MILKWAAEHLTDRAWVWFARLYKLGVLGFFACALTLAWMVWRGDEQATRATLALLALYLCVASLRLERDQ